MIISLGSTQAGSSEDKEISSEIHLHSVEREGSVVQQEQPATPVTSSSFEHQNVESSRCNDGEDAACDVPVPLTSSSTDSSAEGDTDNSDSTKTAEELVDKI